MTTLLLLGIAAWFLLLLAYGLERLAHTRTEPEPDTSRGLLPRDHYR